MVRPFERWIAGAAAGVTRLAAWTEAHPRRAWTGALLLVLLLVGYETSYWPRVDYPRATWHHDPPGIEVEVVHAKAATAGWNELWSYWTGRIIHGNDYYQPLTSWLFVAEYRLFGTDNRAWTVLNVVLHPLFTLVLAWVTSLFVAGCRLRRLSAGVLAALLFGAPGLADRSIQEWVVGWWPVQPDILALLCGLLSMAAAYRYAEAPSRWLAAAAVGCFFLAVCFKETGYATGVGACLLLVRRRRAWNLLALLAGAGLLFFAMRWLALDRTMAFGTDNRPARIGANVLHWLRGTQQELASAGLPALFLLLSAAVAAGVRRAGRCGTGEAVLLTGALYLGVSWMVLGPPTDVLALSAHRSLTSLAAQVLALIGVALTLRRWPWPELGVVWTLNALLAACFLRVYGWHRYWSAAFGCMLLAMALVCLSEAVGTRLGWAPKGADAPPANELQ